MSERAAPVGAGRARPLLKRSSMRPAIASFTMCASLLVASAASAQERPIDTAAPPPVASSGDTEMNSVPLFVTGTSLAAVGTGSFVAGAVIFAEDSCTTEPGQIFPCSMGFGRFFGALMMGGGGLLALAGTPMIVAGSWQVPGEDGGASEATATLGVGAGHARLDVTF